MDWVVVLFVHLAFAAWLTTHCALALAIARQLGKSVGCLAFLLPPAAPWLGLRAGFRRRGCAWLVLGATYGGALLLASQ